MRWPLCRVRDKNTAGIRVTPVTCGQQIDTAIQNSKIILFGGERPRFSLHLCCVPVQLRRAAKLNRPLSVRAPLMAGGQRIAWALHGIRQRKRACQPGRARSIPPKKKAAIRLLFYISFGRKEIKCEGKLTMNL